MNNNRLSFLPTGCGVPATRLMQATALALMVALAMPAWAANIRAIKSRIPHLYP